MKILFTIAALSIISICLGQKQRFKIGEERRQFTLYVPKVAFHWW